MKVIILNCFETNENRVKAVFDFFTQKLNNVTIVQSDFNHIMKSRRKHVLENYIFIKSIPYYKNISVNRLISHYKFSIDAISVIKEERPDVLYVIFPPNSLAKFASKYKRSNPNVRLIFDIMDLWPETMPIKKYKKFLPFIWWGEMRDKSLKNADLIITECELYKDVLFDALKGLKVKTLYLSKSEISVYSHFNLSNDEVHLAYLGSINNIIDIPKIIEIIMTIKQIKPVTLHIIGDGENKDEFILLAESAGANVKYYGRIFDDQRKQDIFDHCHFGLNIMKSSVCVGLTMKSIDYFQHGLPIINNIPADTKEIVEKYGVGVNIMNGMMMLIKIVSESNNHSILNMKSKSLEVFKEKFSVGSFTQNMNNFIEG